ncbi:TetR/AcrR family transcriptional regulator [Sphingobacterium spiritivorum]|uniref:TetR/AcrR family transcriptional regulator n=1 Tax=Sphingobacterium spiritivorum TaxID=258 RepID=UPI003F77138C
MKKHRGEILKEVFEDQGVNISKVAKKIGVDRATVYRHFADRQLSIDYIVKYGQAIDYDFSKYFPELLQVVQDPSIDFEKKAPKTYSELERDVNYWKDKYIDLLEQYNRLISDKLFQLTK